MHDGGGPRGLDVGVGGEVQLWASDDQGGFSQVRGNELRDVEHGVTQWTVIERESLDEILGTGPSEADTEAVLAPEPLAEEDGSA